MRPRILRGLLAAVTAAIVLVGCGRPASPVSIDELARNPSRYSGQTVATAGELHYHPSPPHYWIESEAGTRVEVIGVQDPVLTPGARLAVTGTFRYSRERGRRIEVETQDLRY